VTVRELIARLSELPPDAIALVIDQRDGEARVDDVFLTRSVITGERRVYITGNY